MFLSILIPTHNYSCVALCREMSRQVADAGIDAEIIVVDDASDDVQSLTENRSINDIAYCRLIENPDNIGIARNRNRLAQEAQGEYLLFLDSDVYPVKSTFVKEYVRMKDLGGVLCGGLTYRLDGPAEVCPLRYAYGMKYEVVQSHFISLNFFMSAELFHKVEFDESFSKYGHEDTKFGMEIEKLGYSLNIVNNPVYHDNNDSSELFLKKTRVAIDNLVEHRDVLSSTSRLLQFYDKLKPFHLGKIIGIPYSWFRGAMERNLLGKRPSLFVYNIYKISYLCTRL